MLRFAALIVVATIAAAVTYYARIAFLREANPQISLKTQSRHSAVQAANERTNRDHAAQWKTPITFYGIVQDESKNPVRDAVVRLQWTDLSVHGTSTKETRSDSKGRFSLSGVRGKRLVVDVGKTGYYQIRNERGSSFEFSMPAEKNYYEPDMSSPVLFQLRKKGLGAPMTMRSLQIITPRDGSPVRVDLMSGKESKEGDLIICAWRPQRGDTRFPYDWRLQLTVLNGGFAVQSDQFGFDAPSSGYSGTFDRKAHAEGPGVSSEMAGKLFVAFGEPRRYGRLEFRTAGRDSTLYLDYVLNPDGSTYLEPVSHD